ncbi:hypothetical protein [Streptomyces bobili]|uniref:hypothetical protein n=1 Tax=Streptomyces bobili TaxID=67280 RepID=UPI003713A8A4
MAKRFENASLVLGPAADRSAALCRFAGRPGAEQNTTTLAVADAALAFTERLEGVDDVRELRGCGRQPTCGATRRTPMSCPG